MTQRCDGITMPDYYTAPTRRPNWFPTGSTIGEVMAWDMSDYWRTSAEWLAWIKRKEGRPRHWGGNGQKWHYPVRPEVAAHCFPRSTLKIRRLP